jgi:tRNA-Thr(GGU) m(6)t(6)A37 methyltransferase TsaA
MVDSNGIGIIHSPFTELENMPIQPKGAREVIGTIEIYKEYSAGLADLQGFSHIYLLYRFHRASRTALTVTPFMDNRPRGVFATRSPLRPSHIGMSIVELSAVDQNLLKVRGIDVLNGTPLLDIKPYIAAFDAVDESRSGWMTGSETDVASKRSDGRFVDQEHVRE